MFHIKQNKGQTLVEATIALASILLTLAAISVAISTSLNNSQFIKNQSQAGKYAQEGMEYVRYLRNTDPASFEARQGIYCMNEDNSLTSGSCTAVNVGTSYKREVEFTQDVQADCGGGTKTTVSVYWASGKCGTENRFCHSSKLVSCFAEQQAGSDL